MAIDLDELKDILAQSKNNMNELMVSESRVTISPKLINIANIPKELDGDKNNLKQFYISSFGFKFGNKSTNTKDSALKSNPMGRLYMFAGNHSFADISATFFDCREPDPKSLLIIQDEGEPGSERQDKCGFSDMRNRSYFVVYDRKKMLVLLSFQFHEAIQISANDNGQAVTKYESKSEKPNSVNYATDDTQCGVEQLEQIKTFFSQNLINPDNKNEATMYIALADNEKQRTLVTTVIFGYTNHDYAASHSSSSSVIYSTISFYFSNDNHQEQTKLVNAINEKKGHLIDIVLTVSTHEASQDSDLKRQIVTFKRLRSTNRVGFGNNGSEIHLEFVNNLNKPKESSEALFKVTTKETSTGGVAKQGGVSATKSSPARKK